MLPHALPRRDGAGAATRDGVAFVHIPDQDLKVTVGAGIVREMHIGVCSLMLLLRRASHSLTTERVPRHGQKNVMPDTDVAEQKRLNEARESGAP